MKLLLRLAQIPFLRGLIHRWFFKQDKILKVLEEENKSVLPLLSEAKTVAFEWGQDKFEDEIQKLLPKVDDASDQLEAEIKKVRTRTRKKKENGEGK